MDLDRYAALDSTIHTWDPRFKLFSLFSLVFIFASIKEASSLALIAVFSILLILLTRIPIRFVLRTLRAPLLFLVVMTPLLVFTAGGPVLISWGFLKVYSAGLYLAGRVGVRALSIMLVFLALFGTSRLHQTMKAMAFFKLPAALLAIFLFTYRYIFLYIEDLQKLFTAARMRGYTTQAGLLHARSTVGILVTLLIRSNEQSERLYASMQARGFQGKFYSLEAFRMRTGDFVKSTVVLAVAALLIFLEL